MKKENNNQRETSKLDKIESVTDNIFGKTLTKRYNGLMHIWNLNSTHTGSVMFNNKHLLFPEPHSFLLSECLNNIYFLFVYFAFKSLDQWLLVFINRLKALRWPNTMSKMLRGANALQNVHSRQQKHLDHSMSLLSFTNSLRWIVSGWCNGRTYYFHYIMFYKDNFIAYQKNFYKRYVVPHFLQIQFHSLDK